MEPTIFEVIFWIVLGIGSAITFILGIALHC